MARVFLLICDIKKLLKVSKKLAKLVKFPLEKQNYPIFLNFFLRILFLGFQKKTLMTRVFFFHFVFHKFGNFSLENRKISQIYTRQKISKISPVSENTDDKFYNSFRISRNL
jgi:hypothetical protein